MSDQQLEPDDPELVERFIQWMRSLSREEWIAELSAAPGWDPAWLETPSDGPATVAKGRADPAETPSSPVPRVTFRP